MNKHHTIALKPPAATRPLVIARRRTLEQRDNLRAGAIALAFASAMGDLDARNKLAALPAKLAALQVECDLSPDAQELAHAADSAAEIEWRKAVQQMDPPDAIEGINAISCCARCVGGVSCILTGSAPYAGGECAHPVRQRHLFNLNDQGLRVFAYADNPTAARFFDAAVRRLGVGKEFA
jgi:hypothetical protein